MRVVLGTGGTDGGPIADPSCREPRRDAGSRPSLPVDDLPGFVYRCHATPDRALVSISAGATDLLGRPPETLLTTPPRSYLDVVHPADRASVRDAAIAATSDDTSHDLTYRLESDEGDPRWVRDRGRVVVDAQTGQRWIDGFVWDIDDHVATEQALERSRHRLEQAQTMARLGHWESDLLAGTVTWSPTIYAIFGLDLGFRPEPDSFYLIVHPADLDRVIAAEQQGALTGYHEVVHRIVRPDGTVRVVHEVVNTETGPDGDVERLIGTAQDVTELTEMQASLHESEARLQRVLMATEDGWWDADQRTGELVLAPRWWAIHGYEPDELPVSADLWKTLIHPDDVERIEEESQQVYRVGARTFAFECRITHKDGHAVPVMIRGMMEYDDEGRPLRASGATTDLTEAKRIERMKSEFVATVSHELRTPLTSIIGALGLVTEGVAGEVPSEAAQLLRIAHANSQRLGLLIDDLLDMEKLVSGKIRFDLALQPLLPIIEQAVRDNAIYAERYEVQFRLTQPGEDVLVRVDPQRLHQVLTNYLSNAAKFSPRGADVEVVVRQPSPQVVRVEVIDQGPGVPDGFRDRAFESFSQADSSDARQQGGTGLGLAISKGIVERLGGSVGFESDEGRTCFHFDLPVHPPDPSRQRPGPRSPGPARTGTDDGDARVGTET